MKEISRFGRFIPSCVFLSSGVWHALVFLAVLRGWREVLTSCTTGVVKTLQKLVEIMPDAVVRFLDQLVTETGDPQKTNYKVNYDLGLIQGKYEQAKVRGRKRTTDSGEKTSSQDDVNVAVRSKTKNAVDAPISSLALIEMG